MKDRPISLAPRRRLLARYQDEAAGPPTGVEAAIRCTDHGRFIAWTAPPAPPCRVACPAECAAPIAGTGR